MADREPKGLAWYLVQKNLVEVIDNMCIQNDWWDRWEQPTLPFPNFYPPEKEEKVDHPPHYKAHPSGVECIQITEHMNFCLGNAVKYIWRADEKYDAIEDLRKAAWYINREIERRQSGTTEG